MEKIGFYRVCFWLFITTFFCGNFAFGDFIACPQVQAYGHLAGDSCGEEYDENNPFNPCIVLRASRPFHEKIRQTLQDECQTEQTVARIEAEHEQRVQQALFAGNQRPLLQLTAHQQEVMHRLRPNEYGGPEGETGPAGGYRSDDCIGNHVRDFLVSRSEACNPDHVRQACGEEDGGSQKVAERALERANRSTETAMSYRTPSAALEFARERVTILDGLRLELKDSNMACSNAITALQSPQCLQMYDEFFNDPQRADLVGKLCTHQGLYNNVQEFVAYMNSQIATPIYNMSTAHIKNRQAEDAVAEEFVKLSNYIVRVQEQLNPSPDRTTASEGD